MTELLGEAFTEVSKLPPEDQNAIADWLLAELKSERRWDAAFAASPDMLKQMADEALEEHRRGETVDLDPESL